MMKRRGGLGRGLDALLESEDAGVRQVPVDRLSPNRLQPRADFDDDGMRALAESIRRQGIVQPIVVTPRKEGGFTIVAGERRWRAARRAGLEELPVVVREIDGDRELLEMALVENLQRSDLNCVEEAEAFRSLHDLFGLSHEDIGAQVGKSRATVSNALRLLGLPEEIQKMLRQGQLTAGQARPLLSIGDAKEQIDLAKRAVREALSARQIERLTAGERRPVDRRRGTPVDPDTAAAAEQLTRKLQCKVEIRRRGKGGSVRLHFHTEEELMRLYDLLMNVGGHA